MSRLTSPFKYFKEALHARRLERELRELSTEVEFASEIKILKKVSQQKQPLEYRKRSEYLKVVQTPVVSRTKFSWLTLSEISLATAGLVLVISFIAKSQPGDELHTYKNTARQFSVILSPSAQDRARATVSLAQKNLEATTKLVQADIAPEKKQAAVAEISKQTADAIEQVAKITAKPANKESEIKQKQELALQLTALVAEQLELAKEITAKETDPEKSKPFLAEAEANAQKVSQIQADILVEVTENQKDIGGANADEVDTTTTAKSEADTTAGEVKEATETKPAPSAKLPTSGKTDAKKDDTIDTVETEVKPVEFKAGFIPEPTTPEKPQN